MRSPIFLRILFTLLIFIILFKLSPYSYNFNKYNSSEDEELSKAEVLEILKSDTAGVQKIKVKVEEGTYKNKEFTIDNTLVTGNQPILLNTGDEVLLLIQNNSNELEVFIYEYIREKKILYLISIFIILVLIIGGLKGLTALTSVVFTICVISILLLPGLLNGYNPVKLTIICCIIIAFFSLIIQNGISKKTIASFIGALGGITAAGIITMIMSNCLNITINSDDCMQLMKIPQNINFNFRDILFSSVLIGALGANIDMSMSVATAMNELKYSNKYIKRQTLIKSGMNVGRDVIGTMCNTLVLAYVGSTLAGLLIFMAYNINLNYIINMEEISIEILRSFAGSIGIVLSVPITVFARAFMD